MMTLDGKKTYITAAVAALASFALAVGWLSQGQYEVVLGLLGSLGLAALRAGVAKRSTDEIKENGQDEAVICSKGAEPTAGFSVGANCSNKG
jgi:hypothetical protein